MMIRPGSVKTVRPPSWVSRRAAAEVIHASRPRAAAPGAIGVRACAGGGARPESVRRSSAAHVVPAERLRAEARSALHLVTEQRSVLPARRSAPERPEAVRYAVEVVYLRPGCRGRPRRRSLRRGAAAGGAPGRRCLAREVAAVEELAGAEGRQHPPEAIAGRLAGGGGTGAGAALGGSARLGGAGGVVPWAAEAAMV